LPDEIELVAIQLPGRESRVKEAFIASMDDLIGGIVEAITPFLNKPYAIFGHSFGALNGFEVIRELRRRGLNQPFLFIPAGRQAPQIKSKKPPIASLPREEFIEELRKEYGDHIGRILDSAELREVFIPQIHADFALSETYHFQRGQPVDCPIVAFGGAEEEDLEAHELNAWSAQTNRRFRSQRFPGDHFFIRQSQELVIAVISREIVSVRGERTFGSRALLA
jgi:surfactin synthase thioesterase subunit